MSWVPINSISGALTSSWDIRHEHTQRVHRIEEVLLQIDRRAFVGNGIAHNDLARPFTRHDRHGIVNHIPNLLKTIADGAVLEGDFLSGWRHPQPDRDRPGAPSCSCPM